MRDICIASIDTVRLSVCRNTIVAITDSFSYVFWCPFFYAFSVFTLTLTYRVLKEQHSKCKARTYYSLKLTSTYFFSPFLFRLTSYFLIDACFVIYNAYQKKKKKTATLLRSTLISAHGWWLFWNGTVASLHGAGSRVTTRTVVGLYRTREIRLETKLYK